jgi:hypothetical protein
VRVPGLEIILEYSGVEENMRLIDQVAERV